MDKLLNDLNDRQREAVVHTDGPMLIVAGAGSGKTRVITYKVAYLIAKGIADPFNITAVTFTNKATQEMRNRIEDLLTNRIKTSEQIYLSGLTVLTFHSLCSRILREHIDRLGMSNDFVIYDTDDQRALISRLMDDHNIDKKDTSPKEVVSFFSGVKNGTSFLRPDSKLTKVYHEYEQELKKSSALDFGDLLIYAHKLFAEHKDILEIYQDRAKYLFVDEYQDTNRIQYKLIKLLSAKHRNICVVGDEDQSIYKWRGADINNILDFEKDYNDAKVIKLEQNYRSTSNIISSSSSLIANNFQRKHKTLFTEQALGEKVKVISMVNDIRETEYIVGQIKKHYINGFRHEEMAIFYRINAQSRLLEEHLRRSKIPYKIIGGIRFYDRKEIKDLISYLRLIVNPNDNIGLERIINIPARGIGKTTLDKLSHFAKSKKMSIYSALPELVNDDGFSSATKKKLAGFLELMDSIRALNEEGSSGSIILKTIIDKTNYMDFLRDKTGHEADERIDNVSELLGAMADFEETSEDKTLIAFLESVALIGDTDEEAGDEHGVKLMTLHSAKGLEFPVVFIQGVEYGLLPYIRYGSDDVNDIEEERRLLYVGMTRAMKVLYLTWARSRRVFGGIKARYSSKFLEEIDEKHVDAYSDEDSFYKETETHDYTEHKTYTNSANVKKDKPKTHSSGYSYDYSAGHADNETGSAVGTKVRHATYGHGVIRAIEGKGDKAKVTVHFSKYGVKKLIWGYANLTVC
ncbi:MAG: UvrD-helicase domain-containing protein [Proteobacteria bacterium]|nr:UvrD-helicase domain-containing protein [Pseudomonadota bacterium]